jgi:hypothetical protein
VDNSPDRSLPAAVGLWVGVSSTCPWCHKGKKEEGRWLMSDVRCKKEEGRGMREEGRRMKEEG